MRWIARTGVLLAALVPLALSAPEAGALELQSVGGIYENPVYVTSSPSDPDRLFVVEQAGTIKLTTPAGTSTFADLTDQVLDDASERGLLSMAFAPDFASSGLFYVYYTREPDGYIQVAEMHASGNAADPGSLRPVISIPHSDNANHNGGQLQFGPDGYLYFATGDGGGGDDPNDNAQNLEVRLGKLLRIDPRRTGSAAYATPASNPFVGVPRAKPEIWSYGLRNPYRFSFDRLTGALTIGDVGQGAREEVDYVAGPGAGRGLNFGWDCLEGTQSHPLTNAPCAGPFTEPIHEYDHSQDGGSCAITGGYVVRDPGLTELYGRYVYADYCAGVIRSLAPGAPAGERAEEVRRVQNPSSFGEDSCGRVYVVSHTLGTVSRLIDSTPTDCTTAPPPAEDCTVRIEGDGGRNDLDGGPGSQAIAGRGGDDRLRGGEGNDCIDGGAGADALSGNGGADIVRGGVGGDVLRARDGERDVVVCGKGKDRAIVDHRDRDRGCERTREKAA
jgi:Ca2+-binding RTX toxin-like protein